MSEFEKLITEEAKELGITDEQIRQWLEEI